MRDSVVQHDAGTHVDYNMHLAQPLLEILSVFFVLNHEMNLRIEKSLESSAISPAVMLAIA